MNMGYEKILQYFKFNTYYNIVIFLLNDVMSISKHVHNHSSITHLPHLREIAKVNINGYVQHVYLQYPIFNRCACKATNPIMLT